MRHILTEADKKAPYVKWFYRPMTPAPKEIFELLDQGPVNPAEALPIHRRDELFLPGELPVERGWCIMPDGSGFVASHCKMLGVTAEMLDWWFYWHGLTGLRYAIWDTDDHYEIHVAPEGLERRLNPDLSYRERYQNTTDVVTEDVGTGCSVLDINFITPEAFGYDLAAFERGASTAVCAVLGPHGDPSKRMVSFSHVAREIPGGIEVRSRFWIGWKMVDGKPVRVYEMPAELIKDLAFGLAFHAPKEYHNLAAILPGVYNENVNIIDRIEDFR